MNAAGMPAATSPLRREARACSQVSRPSGVRTISTCGAPAAAFSFSSGSSSSPSSRAAGCGALLSSTFTGVSSAASASSPASAASIAASNPALPSCAASRALALSTQPGETGNPQQHGHDLRGPLGRHVPVRGQHHRGGVQHRPVGHRAGVRARRRLRERDRPAAPALQARQRPLGHRPDDLHVDDLRPPRARGRRAVQASPALAALRRRLRFLLLIRVRIPGQALALVPGLPAPLAVPAPLPLRLRCRARRACSSPRSAPSTSASPSQSCPSTGAVPAPPAAAPAAASAPARHPAPARSTAFSASFASTTARSRDSSSRCSRDLTGRARLLRHEPQACSTCTKGQTPGAIGVSLRRSAIAHGRVANCSPRTPDSRGTRQLSLGHKVAVDVPVPDYAE